LISKLTIRPLDWDALLLLLYEAPSILWSQDRSNSIGAAEVVALSIPLYFVVRLLIGTPLRTAWFAGVAGICGSWLAYTGIRQFIAGANHLATVGLTDLVAFRAIFIHPAAEWVSGENFTLLLLTLPFACAAAAWVMWRLQPLPKTSGLWAVLALLPSTCIATVLLLSLSRAVVGSTLFFFIDAFGLMVLYKVVNLRIASLMLAGCCGALLLVLICETPLYPGIFRAYGGHHVSQTRSTEGRIDTWHRSLEVVREHSVWGVGSSNAALFLLSSADEDDTTGFTSRTFSLPIQILVEKGVIGFILYSAFLLALAWEFHRNMRLSVPATAALSSSSASTKRKPSARYKADAKSQLDAENAHRAMKCIFGAGLAAVLLRELTYSSLLEHTATLALAFTLAALMIAPTRPSDREIKQLKPLAIAVAVIVLIFQWPYWRYMQANGKLKDFYSEVAAAHFTTARESIDDAIHLWPWNARLYGWRAYVESQQLPSQCPGDAKNGGHPLSDSDRHTAQAAADDYRHSLALNARDAVAHHNLAWLEHLLGDNTAAAEDWKQAVDLDPGNAAFHLSYGMFLDEAGSGEAARAQYESAIELTPSILDSQFFTRYRSRSPRAADSLVRDVTSKLETRLGSGNDPILEARLGKIYLFEGDTSRAEKLLNDAAKQLPNLPLVWFNLGQLYEGQADSTQARLDFSRAREIDSSLAGPYLQLGQMSLRDGDKHQATQYFEQTIQRWQRINPVTSAHNNRLYDGPRQPIDDLLPTTLVWYISPCGASEAWRGLSAIYPQKATAYAQRSRTCEELPSPHLGAS